MDEEKIAICLQSLHGLFTQNAGRHKYVRSELRKLQKIATEEVKLSYPDPDARPSRDFATFNALDNLIIMGSQPGFRPVRSPRGFEIDADEPRLYGQKGDRHEEYIEDIRLADYEELDMLTCHRQLYFTRKAVDAFTKPDQEIVISYVVKGCKDGHDSDRRSVVVKCADSTRKRRNKSRSRKRSSAIIVDIVHYDHDREICRHFGVFFDDEIQYIVPRKYTSKELSPFVSNKDDLSLFMMYLTLYDMDMFGIIIKDGGADRISFVQADEDGEGETYRLEYVEYSSDVRYPGLRRASNFTLEGCANIRQFMRKVEAEKMWKILHEHLLEWQEEAIRFGLYNCIFDDDKMEDIDAMWNVGDWDYKSR